MADDRAIHELEQKISNLEEQIAFREETLSHNPQDRYLPGLIKGLKDKLLLSQIELKKMESTNSQKNSLNEADFKKQVLKDVIPAIGAAEAGPVGAAVGEVVAEKLDEKFDEQPPQPNSSPQQSYSPKGPSLVSRVGGGLKSFFGSVGRGVAAHGGGATTLVMFWIVSLLIIALGPFFANLYGVDNGVVGLTGLFVLGIILVLIEKSGIVGDHRFVALIYLVIMNIVLKYIFVADQFLIGIFGGDPILVILMFFLLSIMFFLKLSFPLFITTKFIFIFVVIFFFTFFGSYIAGYGQSGRLQGDIDRGTAEVQSDIQNTNLWQRVKNQFSLYNQQGRGDVNPTVQQEEGYKYFGVSMERPEVITNSFTNAPIIRIDYNTDSESQFLLVQTTCMIEDVSAIVDPQLLQLSSFVRQPVRCEFPELTEGSYVAKVTGLYSFSSTLKQPVYYVTQQEINSIINSGEDVTEALGTVLEAEVNNGPLDFGVSNAKVNNKKTFEQPIVIDLDKQTRPPHTIEFELKNPSSDKSRSGDIAQVNAATLSVPPGVVVERCGTLENLQYTVDQDGLWSYDVTSHFSGVETSLIIQCDFAMQDTNQFFSVARQRAQDNIYLSVDYTYVIEQSVPVVVE